MATEREAHLFAMYFLIGEEPLRRALKEIGWPVAILTPAIIENLADRFGVESTLMRERLADMLHGTA